MTDHVEPAPQVANDMVKRGLLVLPLFVVVGALVAGAGGAASALLGVGVVLVNFTIAARGLAWAARVSPNAVAATSLLGYIVRLGVVLAVYLVFRNESWFHVLVFGITLLVTHMGLLVWETRYVGLSLGAPGLKPGPLDMDAKE
jgi:hypothetical protein